MKPQSKYYIAAIFIMVFSVLFGVFGCNGKPDATKTSESKESTVEDKPTKRMPTSYPEAVEFIAGVELSEEFDWSRMSEIERLERWLVLSMPKGTLIDNIFYYEMSDPNDPNSQLKGWEEGMLTKEEIRDIAFSYAKDDNRYHPGRTFQIVLAIDKEKGTPYYSLYFLDPFEEIVKIGFADGFEFYNYVMDPFTGENLQFTSFRFPPGKDPRPLRPDQLGPIIHFE